MLQFLTRVDGANMDGELRTDEYAAQVLRPALSEIDRSDLFLGDRTAMFSVVRSPC
jgi:hypothetical protein